MKNKTNYIQILALAVLAAFAPLVLPGCKTVTDPNTGDTSKVFDADKAAAFARTASNFGAYAWLQSHPQDIAWFRAAVPVLRTAGSDHPLTPAELQQLLDNVPANGIDKKQLMLALGAVTALYDAVFGEWQSSTTGTPGDIKKVVNAVADGFEMATLPMTAKARYGVSTKR